MKNVVDTAIEAGNFKTLVKAVQEAGLVDILNGSGPFTVFAPTDDAFSKIPSETLQKILQDKEKLTSILTYHVIPSKVLADQVTTLKNVKTVNGKEISIDTEDGVKVDNANVIKTDIECSNGVIHVIDTVLLP